MSALHDDPVCVTGATGFVGSHVVRELLERGYRVRGTVRDPADQGKSAHLWRLAAGARDHLELVAADLMQPGSFHPAVSGCRWVCHVASPVLLAAADAQRQIVDPAVEGTRNVFSAIAEAGGVERMGLTSSIAAVISNRHRPGHLYTEENWCEDADLSSSPYPLAKTLAEKEAWRLHAAIDAAARFPLTVINPVLVTGPVYTRAHLRTSPAVVRDVLRGKFRGCPPLSFSLVDVRDVANALVNGLEKGVTGRFILYGESLWLHQMAEILAARYPAFRVPTRKLPGFLMYVAALFDKRIPFSFVRRNLNRQDKISNEKLRRELGVEPRPVADSLAETCASMIDGGWVKPKA